MAKFAAYNSAGTIIGFYDNVESPVPSNVPALAITDAQWTACLATPGYTISAGTLVPPSAALQLVAAQQVQNSKLSQACQAEIVAGFPSSALGAPHTYASDSPVSQANLQSAATTALTPGLSSGWTAPLWCEDSTGTWNLANHTTAQVQQVLMDWQSFRMAQQTKLAGFQASVNAASNIGAVQAISWH